MTYNQATEIVLRKLASGDIPDDFPVKEEEVFFVLNMVAPLLIKKDFFETFNLDRTAVDPTIYTTITTKVFKSDSVGEFYAVLPNAPLILLGSMIPQVSYTKDRFVDFTYVDSGKLNNFKNAKVLNEIGGYIFTYEFVAGCDTEHRLVFFDLEDCVETLKIRLVQNVNFSNFNPNSSIAIKPELEMQLIDQTYNWFLAQDGGEEDKIIDNRNNNKIT